LRLVRRGMNFDCSSAIQPGFTVEVDVNTMGLL
jgi:hypothetical protein